jgi:hypothetical protein
MPLLATLFKAILYQFAGFWAQYVSARLAVGLAVATLFTVATSVLVVALGGAASALVDAMPSWISRAVCWFWPDNGNVCIASIMSAEATRWAYDVNRKYLEYASNWK